MYMWHGYPEMYFQYVFIYKYFYFLYEKNTNIQ